MAIKYKGFEIRKVYHICADWKLNKNGTVIARKPKPEDISHYCILTLSRIKTGSKKIQ